MLTDRQQLSAQEGERTEPSAVFGGSVLSEEVAGDRCSIHLGKYEKPIKEN